ncbi:MAG: ribonuclease J [Clostridia bacterium]|nr:ribonuclease J [Clostridia bacterium]
MKENKIKVQKNDKSKIKPNKNNPNKKLNKKQEKPQSKTAKDNKNKKPIKKQQKVVLSKPINKKPTVINVTAGKNEKKVLKVRFLGGVGEIGKNMTVLEYGKDIIVIDAGLSFPTDNMPGVDLVIPDITFLEQNKSKIKGIIITHGHEDHIGSLPFILKDVKAPIFGTKLTLTLIENRLKEQNINNVSLNCIKPKSVIKLGCFSIEFINVNHSIAGAVALSITTPVGVVFHSGDFKIDYTPVSGETTDLRRISEIGDKGVLLMLAESTNIEIEGTTMSESVVKETLEHVFSDNAKRRLIIATFASNVHRLQQILDLAVKYKRKVAFSGRSMINIAESASKIGELTIEKDLIVDVEKTKVLKPEETVIISTGTQGEPMSALTRMASGEFNKVKIGEDDTVVISASVIPGNEKMIYGVINNLYRKGAEVIYESLEPIHVSGHACRGELRILHTLIKPKFFIPVHGEYRHLKKHVLLAESLGMKESNTLIADIGDTVELTKDIMKRGERFVAGSRFVDGVGIDGEDSFVFRDRVHLSEDGLMVIVVGLDELSARLNSIEIVTKGLVIKDTLTEEIKANLKNTINQVDLREIKDEKELSSLIGRSIKNFIFKSTKKNPMILPIVIVN